MNANATEVKTDDATMMVDDTPVRLPDRVEVVDNKSGKTIGYRNPDEVLLLLESDPYFKGVQPDNPEDDFILVYNPNAMAPIERSTIDPLEFLKVIEENHATAVGADDPMHLLLGVSYLDKYQQNNVLTIHVKRFRAVFGLLNQNIRDTLNDRAGEGVSQSIIDFFVAQNTKADTND